MTEKTIDFQLEQAAENFQKMLQYLLDNQLQIQQWTETLLQEQAKQWESLNEQVQNQQKKSYEQFQEMVKLVNEIKPAINQDAYDQTWKKLFEQFAPFQSYWSNVGQNPYQAFFQSMNTITNQQQQYFQQLFKQPFDTPNLTNWTNYFQQFQKSQEDLAKQFKDFTFSKL